VQAVASDRERLWFKRLGGEPTASDRDAASEAIRRAAASEELGRGVEADVTAYERLVAMHGRDGMAAALVARANRRWAAISLQIALPGSFVLPRLARLPSIDAALSELGVVYPIDGTPGVNPAVYAGDWPYHVRWGADSAVVAARFLMLGQGVGAAAVLRQALERWTENRAFALGLTIAAGEPKAAFYDRVWRGGTELRLNIELLYVQLSELLHGRGMLVPIIEWETAELCESDPPPDVLAALAVLADLGSLVLQQITACTLDLAHGAGRTDLETLLIEWPRTSEPPGQAACDTVLPALWPLTPTLLSGDVVMELAVSAEVYERQIANIGSGDRLPLAALAVLAFLHRRHRATQAAVAAFEEEERLVGRKLNWRSLSDREARYLLVNETAAIAGRWVGAEVGAALAFAASAMRSAFVLWLEDDNRAMIAVRAALEAAARARTWRTKPAKAAALSAKGARASPRDWLAAAGWRRFGVLNVALGELSHVGYNARWDGALEALAAAQPAPSEDMPAIHTGRGSVLDVVQYLVGAEAVIQLTQLSPELGTTARSILGIGADPEVLIERWLQIAGNVGTFDLGGSIFQPPPTDPFG
jgi:hypothetical protein